MSNIKVKSKRSGIEIGATRAFIGAPWEGYAELDPGCVYFDDVDGRRMADSHRQQAREFAEELNAQN